MARRWADVAELIATQGLKGRFVARSVRNLPFLLNEGMHVSFIPPTLDGPRHVRVKSVQHQGNDEYLVEFSGVKNRDSAELIVGSHCLVSCDELPEDYERMGLSEAELLKGFAVYDEKLGYVGVVKDVDLMPMQDLLVVVRDGADQRLLDFEDDDENWLERLEGEEVLIPFVEEFLIDIDEEELVLLMDLPTGLLDINQAVSVD